MNIQTAVEGITALANLIAEISTVIGRAQSEGRDLTPEESEAIRVKRKAAVDRLLSR